ncbi:MAG: hypothetical protein Q7J98_01535 [Kiritimatiellia bacterium]|nr:hypothetical protein [Kiritimatiellia bacterium]
MMSHNGIERVSRWRAFDSDRLFRHSLIVFLFTHAVSAANILFQMVMGWNLSVAEYGILSSMLGLMMLIATPMAAISNTLAHFTANLIKEERIGNIRVLTRQWTSRILFISIILLILLFVLRNPLASFFHLATPWPLLLVGLALFVSALAPVFGGVLQGMQAFVLAGFPGLANGFVRLCLGGILVFFVAPKAVSGLSAQVVGALCATALIYLFYRRRLPQSAQTDSTPERSDKYFWASLAALFSFAILMNMDIVMVKHYFTDPADYGNYARASMIGKMLIFLVQPIAGVMFPKVASRGDFTNEQKFTFFRALALSGLIIIGGVLLCTLFPQIPLLILYRDHAPTPDMIALVRMVCWAMAPLGLVFILMNFELAQHRLACVFPLAFCAAAFVGGVALFHGSLRQVVIVFLTVSVTALVLLIILPFTKHRNKAH